MPDYVKALSNTSIPDDNLNKEALDRVYMAANLSSTINIDLLGKTVKHTNMLSRNQFVESLVRCAQTKYILPADSTLGDKTLFNATKILIKELKGGQLPIVDIYSFRNELWNTKISNAFKAQDDNIYSIMESSMAKNNVEDKSNMVYPNVIATFVPLGFKEIDVLEAFALCKQTNVKEYHDSDVRFNKLKQVEIYELIGRLARLKYQGGSKDLEQQIT